MNNTFDFSKVWDMIDKLLRAIWAFLTKPEDENADA